MQQLTSQEAINVLSAWIAIEVLSPQSFRKQKDLCPGNSSEIVLFDNDSLLPWQEKSVVIPPNNIIFYQIILGTINVKPAITKLIDKYGADNEESCSIQGESIIALVTVDQFGRIVKDDTSLAVSSFAWGVPRALKGELKNLSQWPVAEPSIISALYDILSRKDLHDKDIPVDMKVINKAHNYVVDSFEIPQDIRIDKIFAIKRTYSLKRNEPPETLLLNSFYLNDLVEAQKLIQKNQVPPNLLKYLGMHVPAEKYNILDNPAVLKNAVAPINIPLARWPGPGRHPLVLLQQAAVNLSMNELKNGGIMAINGPPGTGKTTLLRDIVAATVLERAKILYEFEDPSNAFIDSGIKISVGKSYLKLYKLDKKLKGFEILIASSNNKAVENISAEFPNISAVAEDADELRYFNTLSDSIFGCKTWGMISAVLGNASNRSNFCQKFWWDENCGFLTYLAHASGRPQLLEIEDPKTKETIEVLPKIIQEEDPPHNHADALRRWKKAKENFRSILKKTEKKFSELQEIKILVEELSILETELNNGCSIEEILFAHQQQKPMILWRLLRTVSAKAWEQKNSRLFYWQEIKNRVDKYSKKTPAQAHIVDNNLFLKSHQEIHLVSPWCDKETQLLRDKLFTESIKLHKAFIDAAARPLRHNLGALMQSFNKKGALLYNDWVKVMHFLPELWPSFFLVVPCVSTTFASVERMLGYLPNDSLGWLIVDEAGQALPQAAVGAIMRTKRAVITGDPLQIEPVVTLPTKLTCSIFHQFGVDTRHFNAPEASVQTLADAATPYFAEFNTKLGSRQVGVPLLVHRRCSNPMFSISNKIAYEKLMIKARDDKVSPIRDTLGISTWFDIEGKAQDKWCPEEGEKVLELLYKLKNNSIFPNLYIITPFLTVANNLRKTIYESGILDGWSNIDKSLWVKERIGTVHTVQGREDEAVILVLGAPAIEQCGARMWTGRTPNILNVAVTRAKEVIYVVGNKKLWKEAGVFRELYNKLNKTKHQD